MRAGVVGLLVEPHPGDEPAAGRLELHAQRLRVRVVRLERPGRRPVLPDAARALGHRAGGEAPRERAAHRRARGILRPRHRRRIRRAPRQRTGRRERRHRIGGVEAHRPGHAVPARVLHRERHRARRHRLRERRRRRHRHRHTRRPRTRRHAPSPPAAWPPPTASTPRRPSSCCCCRCWSGRCSTTRRHTPRRRPARSAARWSPPTPAPAWSTPGTRYWRSTTPRTSSPRSPPPGWRSPAPATPTRSRSVNVPRRQQRPGRTSTGCRYARRCRRAPCRTAPR